MQGNRRGREHRLIRSTDDGGVPVGHSRLAMARASRFAIAVLLLLLIGTLGPSRSFALEDRPEHQSRAEGPSSPRFIFGLGDQIGAATSRPVFNEAPMRMITSWYNGRSDLTWMSGYQRTNTMSGWYGKGYAMELVVWLANDPSYAVSEDFQRDIELLTKVFRGNGPHYGPLYIVLFTELETYSKDPAYFESLRTAYKNAAAVIHATYDKAHVGLGFGGYGWLLGDTRDLSAWEPAIEVSDFVAAQHMHHCSRLDLMKTQLPRAIEQLGSYGKPVFVSHFKFWGEAECQRDAFKRFMDEVLTDTSLAGFHRQGLRAWGFMDDAYIRGDSATNRIFGDTKALITRYANHNPVADVVAPSVPPDLRVTGVTGTSVSLTWTASTDDVEVTAYGVYNGTARALSVSGTEATVTGLAPGSTYTFTVTAEDPAGNESAASNAVGATTSADGSRMCPGYEGDPRNQIVGTEHSDVLIGTSGSDIICSSGGDDIIEGEGGPDVIVAGDGNDEVFGNGGADDIDAGGGRDRVVGGRGDDSIAGRAGNDLVAGGRGHDLLRGGGGADELRGGARGDRLAGGRGNDLLNGGGGHDTCFGGAGRDRIRRCE